MPRKLLSTAEVCIEWTRRLDGDGMSKDGSTIVVDDELEVVDVVERDSSFSHVTVSRQFEPPASNASALSSSTTTSRITTPIGLWDRQSLKISSLATVHRIAHLGMVSFPPTSASPRPTTRTGPVTVVSWVPHGVALRHPTKYVLDDAEA